MQMRIADCGLRVGGLTLAALLMLGTVAGAQVGHPPDRSPYKDLRAKQSASILAGYLSGQRGTPQAAPSDGPLFSVRYDRQVGTAAEILIGLSYARLNRYLVDPTVPESQRLNGPRDDDLAFMETGVSLILTGRKTWHGFVPYIGGMGGVVFQTDLGTFSSFTFGTRLSLAPHVGIKWYPVQSIAFKVEARDIIWRVKYPEEWFGSQAPGIPPVLESGTHPQAEWLHHPTLLVSLGYTFTF